MFRRDQYTLLHNVFPLTHNSIETCFFHSALVFLVCVLSTLLSITFVHLAVASSRILTFTSVFFSGVCHFLRSIIIVFLLLSPDLCAFRLFSFSPEPPLHFAKFLSTHFFPCYSPCFVKASRRPASWTLLDLLPPRKKDRFWHRLPHLPPLPSTTIDLPEGQERPGQKQYRPGRRRLHKNTAYSHPSGVSVGLSGAKCNVGFGRVTKIYLFFFTILTHYCLPELDWCFIFFCLPSFFFLSREVVILSVIILRTHKPIVILDDRANALIDFFSHRGS